jgi:hypothetical protein
MIDYDGAARGRRGYKGKPPWPALRISPERPFSDLAARFGGSTPAPNWTIFLPPWPWWAPRGTSHQVEWSGEARGSRGGAPGGAALTCAPGWAAGRGGRFLPPGFDVRILLCLLHQKKSKHRLCTFTNHNSRTSHEGRCPCMHKRARV